MCPRTDDGSSLVEKAAPLTSPSPMLLFALDPPLPVKHGTGPDLRSGTRQPNMLGVRARQDRPEARFASACTAFTIAISPMPLPMEMFWRKMRSTIEQSVLAMSSGGRPDKDR